MVPLETSMKEISKVELNRGSPAERRRSRRTHRRSTPESEGEPIQSAPAKPRYHRAAQSSQPTATQTPNH